MSEPHVCSNPAECCRELSRVWEALNVRTYIPGQGSAAEQVARQKSQLADARTRIAALEQERAEALKVLAVSMPESGLVDACKQVKQAAISERDSAVQAEAECARLRAALAD